MNYGIKKYNEEPKIRIRVASTRGNEGVKTFSVYSKHGNGRMMLRTSRGAMISTDGHTIRSTAFKPKKLYDVLEILTEEEVKAVEFNEAITKTKDALVKEVEKLNKLKESQPDTDDDLSQHFRKRDQIQTALYFIGEAFQALDNI